MAKKVNGLEVAITADTSGVTAGLKDITKESVQATNNLKQVESLLKLDPGNTDLLAERQKVLAQSIEATSKKLETLKNAEADVKRAFDAGQIDDAQYIAFQRELVNTENRLKDLKNQEQQTGDATKTLGNDIDNTDKETSEFSDTLKTTLAAAAQVAAAAVAAIGTAAVAAVTGVVDLANSTAELGDNIDKSSQKLGMSAEAYQEWDFIMKHSGSTIDGMATSMKRLAEAATDPSDAMVEAFGKIGISMEEVASMSQEELFSATIAGLQSMESGAERTATATDLLGKSAMDLGPLLNTSAEDTEAMRQQLHELGGVMSDEAVKNASAYEDSLLNMQTAVDGFKNGIAGTFIPALSEIMTGVAGVVSGSGDGMDTLMSGLEGFTSSVGETVGEMSTKLGEIGGAIAGAITSSLPDLFELGLDIVAQLADGIISALPAVVDTGTDLIPKIVEQISYSLPVLAGIGTDILMKLVNGIITALPSLASGATQLILTLVSGISQALPQLIPATVRAVATIVRGLVDNIPALIGGALQLIQGLAQGLIAAIPILINNLQAIVNSLVNGLLSSIPQIIEAGTQLLVSITDNMDWIVNSISFAVPEIVFGIVDALMANLPLIIQAGFDLMTALLDNLPEIIAQIVVAIPYILAALWEGFSERFPDMADFGVNMFEQLIANGSEIIRKIVGLIPKIVERIGAAFSEKYYELEAMGVRIFENIQNGIQSLLGNAWTWGSDLVINLANGIWSQIDYLVSIVSSVGQTIADYLGFSEPEKGPLSNFHTYAPDMMALFTQGIRDSEDMLARQFDRTLALSMPEMGSPAPAVPVVESSPIFNVNVSVASIASDYDVNRMTDQMVQQMSAGLAQLRNRQSALGGGF